MASGEPCGEPGLGMKRAWDGWTKQDRLEELRGKLKLKEFDLHAYYELAEAVKQRNEEAIIKMRQEVKNKRIVMADSYDAKVINDVFQDRREERLSLQRHTANEAVAAMDQKVCEKAKYLNALRHARRRRDETLGYLQTTRLSMMEITPKTPEQLENEQRIRSIENSLDKSRMKCDMGKNISHQYEFILKKMKEESLSFPGNLEMIEKEITNRRRQLHEVKKMLYEARGARDYSKIQLAEVEQECQTEKRNRDQILAATRKEVEQRKVAWVEAPTKFRNQIAKPAVEQITDVNASSRMEAEMLVIRNKRHEYDHIVERIKEATGLTSLDAFTTKIIMQDDVRTRLTEKMLQLRKKINYLTAENKKLLGDKYDEKYAGERRLSRIQCVIGELMSAIYKQLERRGQCQEETHVLGSLTVDVKAGLFSLMDKLKDVKLKPGARNYSRGNAMEDLENCTDKLVLLNRKVNEAKETKRLGKTIQEVIANSEFNELVQKQLPTTNIRIRLAESEESITDGFDYDNHDLNEEMLSRQDIKRISLAIVGSKTKKPKKGKKKKTSSDLSGHV